MLERVPHRQQAVAKSMLRAIAYAPRRAEAERKRKEFEGWCHRHGYGKGAETLGRDWERMVTFYRYPKEHWRHLRTTNVVESPFAALRLRTDAAKRFKKVERTTAADGRPDEVPAAERSGAAGQGLHEGTVRGRDRGHREGGRRLMFTRFLTEPPARRSRRWQALSWQGTQ